MIEGIPIQPGVSAARVSSCYSVYTSNGALQVLWAGAGDWGAVKLD